MTFEPSTERSPILSNRTPRRMSLPWLPCVILLSCAAVAMLYWMQTRLPHHVEIAGGPPDGRYRQLAEALAAELQDRLGLKVSVRETQGSFENLRLLNRNEVAIGLYQSQTASIPGLSPDEPVTARFIANIYPEYLFPVTRASDVLEVPPRISTSHRCISYLHAGSEAAAEP